MADLYAPQTQFLNTNGGQSEQQAPQGITGNADVDAYLSSLPESERNAALERLTAPPSADEIGEMVKGGYNPTFEEFDAVEAWHKNHEVSIIDGIGAGIEQVMGDLSRAAGAVIDHPMDVLSKSPANVVESFAQGTRNFYGMAAQSADPTSKLFRFKNFLNGNGTKEERYNQYMEALAFNRHSAELMEGKATVVMDKDLINPEVVQAASYIADPTLFIPFGQAASAGMRVVGLGEKMMLAGAKASAIKNAVIGGTLKWGVGAPVEFLGGAVRNTIDFGIDQGARAIEATTGIGAKEIAQTARLSGVPMSAASFAGHSIPYAGAVSEAYVGASAARGIGEASTAIGDTMIKNKAFGRGINSWAREALENTPNLSSHAKGLLKVLDAVDPAFTYGAAITEGAAHGAFIGGGLGYLSGGEEGFAHGLGAGIALGGIGGGVGKGVADVTNQTLYGRVAIQRKMTIEGLKALGTTEATNKAMAFEALVKVAEGTNDRHYMAHIDGMIAGVDKVAPRSKWFVRSRAEHIDWLLKQEIDPKTGKLIEGAKLFPEFGSDRKARGRALGFLSLLGDQFAGVPDNLVKHLATLPQDHALRKAFFRLSGEQKAAVFEAIKNNANPEFRKALGETQGVERVSDANYEKWVKDNYEYFDPSNPENNAVKLREKLKQIDGSTLEGKKEVNSILERIKHIEEVKKQYNDWANSTTPETRAKADAAMQDAWKGRGSRQMAEPIKPQKANKPKIAEYYGDINYGEMQTARVNELFAKGDIDGAKKLIGQFLKDNTNKDGSLNTRGRILRNKLAAEGYFDKDGNLRPRRYTDNDAQPTAAMYGSNEGFVLKRDATGEIEVHISLDNITKDGVAHELFHAIFKESVLKPDFIDRLSKDLLGTFDKDGKLVKAGSVRRNEIREFFRRYIDLTTDKESDFRDEMSRLESAIKEFETGSEAKSISPDAIATLHQYAEEFGAYYFQNWLRAQSPDFLFRGGKLEGIRGIMDGIKNGWLDFWERTMQSKDPTFDFKSLKEGEIDKGFKTVNGKRVRVSSLDYFMRDFVRATSDTNRGNFDINKLSPEGQAHYIQSNGLRNTHRVDSTGRAVRLSRREAARVNAVAGKEIYKILKGINPNRAVDGDGNFIGRLSDAELDAIVKSGHAPRAWANKLRQAYEILDGNQSNVVEFGYHGKTEQITDASYPRLFGEDVSFKHRKAILLDVELKVGEKGTFYALFHTLDKSVIEARGDNLWKDSAVQALWDGNRGSMEQDFFRYLENASKKDGDQSKKESSSLWVDGKGAQRRDVLHQMLGMAKNEGDTYLNKPIAEIPLGIRHSVTTFNNDGVSSFRVSGTERYKYNHDNAFRLLSRNWKPSEMKAEKTGLGEIITHASGYKFVKDSRGIYRAYDDEGAKIGEFNTIEQAAKAGESSHKQKVTAKQNAIEKEVKAQDKIVAAKKPASAETRQQAILRGDQFDTDEVRAFTEGIDNKNILRQTRDEHIYQRAEEALSDPAALLKLLKERYQSRSSLWDKYDAISKQRLELYNAKEAFYKEKTAQAIRRQNDLAAKWGQNYEAMKMSQEYFDHIRLDTEDKTKYAELQNKHYEVEVIEMDFKSKYKVELAEDGIRTVLKEILEPEGVAMTEKEKADMLVKLVQANVKQKSYHGLLEELFAVDYDDKIQTGVPFVTRTVHGTNNVQLLFSRMFDNKMLASRHGTTTTSSTLGVFSGGSQNTSLHYAGRPTPAASNTSLAGALRKFFANTNKREMYNPDGSLTPYGHAYDVTDALFKRFNTQEERHIRTLYDSYTRIQQNARSTYDKFFVDGEWKSAEEADKYFHWTKMLRDTKVIDFTGDEISGVKNLLPLDEYLANKKGTFAEMFGIGDKTHQEIPPFERSSALDMIREDIAYNLEKSKEVPELFGMVGTKDVPMQTRQLIRMNNPYVVVDPRSYSEYWISPHMQKAIAGGHDGIVFKRFDDGGGRDNVYAVFSEFSDEQIKIMETSFDDESLPLGKDESGRVLKNGKELGLAMKPMEANAPEGGRVYDQQGKQWKTGFIGRQSEENPELTKNVSLQHIDKANGVNKLVFTDNSTGESKNIGHITWDKFGGISTHISPEFRGRGLSYLFYSEAAERMRAQGIKQSVSTIVNKEAIPVKVREAIFGDTRRFISRTEEGKPIGQAEAKAIIAAMQDQGGEYAGVTVSNKIDPNARYKPTESAIPEGGRVYTPEQFKSEFIGRVAAEDPSLTEGLKIEAYKNSIKLLDEKGKQIGRINTWHGEQDVISSSGESFIEPSYRGMGYGKLLYSEMMERLRAQGITEFRGTIADPKNRPIKIRDSIAGNTEYQIVNGTDFSWKSGTSPKQFENWTGGVRNKLDPNAHYKPSEAVMERAKKAGYGSTVFYHGTNKQFTEFDAGAGKRASGGGGNAGYFFFTSQEGEARNYAGMENNKMSDKLTGVGEHTPNTMAVFLKMDNPYDSYEGTKNLTPEQKELVVKYMREHGNYVSREGMESKARFVVSDKYVQLHHLFKYLNRTQRAEMLSSIGFDGIQDGNHVVVFKPEQIKSANDFTYDDAGKEIPLSERFNKNKKDIRWKPVGYEGGDDYYKPKKNIFESRDDRGLLVRRASVGNDEITGNPEARGHQENPDYVGWEDIGHYPQEGTTAENAWEAKNSGLWSWKDNEGVKKRNPMDVDNPGFTHEEWFSRKYNYDDDRPDIFGRYEKPKYDKKGNLIEKGKISISVNYKANLTDMSDALFYKEAVASSLGVPADHIDAYLFGASDKVKAQRGYGAKDQLAIKFKPTEGDEGVVPDIDFDALIREDEEKHKNAYRGKQYTPEQMTFSFIGRYASERPNFTKGLDLMYSGSGTARSLVLSDSNTGKRIGHISLIADPKSPNRHAYIQMSDVVQQGRGYGTLLYSELAERLRSEGYTSIDGRVVDSLGRPIKIRASVIDEVNKGLGGEVTSVSGERVSSPLYPNAWYKPKERTKIGSNASSVGLLLEGLQSGRLVRTSSYKGLGLEDANLIAHTPDTAKIGQVTAGDKALVDLQGGIFYAIANGEKIWASNFAGEGETNLLVNLANKAVTNNKTGKTYIMLVKAGNDKIFASVDGARGVMSIFSHLSETGVIKEEKLVRALRLAGTEELGLKGLEGLSKQEIVSRIDDALLRSNENAITFEKRALFSRDIARQLQDSGVFKSEKAKKALIDSFHQGFAGSKATAEKKGSKRGFSIVEMERVFGNLMAEDIIKDVPEGHAYAAIEITKPLKESKKSDHRGYDASIMHEDETPAKMILFDRTAHITEVVNKRDNSPIKLSDPSRPLKDAEGKIVYEKDEQGNFKLRQNKDKKWVKIPINEYEGEGSYISYTGGNIPYQEVKGKSRMPFKPAEGWRDWKSESTSIGSVVKNTIGYVIMNQGNKFKVYNPAKVMVGIYTDLEQAKRRVQRDEPK